MRAFLLLITLFFVGNTSAQTPDTDQVYRFTYEIEGKEVLASETPERVFKFIYEVQGVAGIPADKPVDIYVPVPARTADQRVLAETIDTQLLIEAGEEVAFGNGFYRLRREAGADLPLTARFEWIVARDESTAEVTELTQAEEAQFLQANSLVPVGHEVLEPIQKEIYQSRTDDSPEATARAIYDWVVDNVEYKKVGSGWGNGDTFWACNERYGNCTDFHALFISLARSEGIPARFEIGFPVPLDRPEGTIGGYHCWVKFYLPERGWVPIDASEAAKHPAQKELLYGTHPMDRIQFTTGRDLIVSTATRNRPLNYFIYPHAEVAGERWQGKVQVQFSYQELSPGLALSQ